MKKLVLTNEVVVALTTPAYAKFRNLGSNHYEKFLDKGHRLLENLHRSYILDNGITDQNQMNAISGKAGSNESLAILFSIIEKRYNLNPYIDWCMINQGGPSTKVKAKMLKSLLCAIFVSGQNEVLDDIFDEIKRNIPLNYIDPIVTFNEILRKNEYEYVDSLIIIKNNYAGSTQDRLIFQGIINYLGISVSAIGTTKQSTRTRVCQKWVDKYKEINQLQE